MSAHLHDLDWLRLAGTVAMYTVAMLLAAVVAARGDRLGIAILVLLSLAWFRINNSLGEGSVLVVIRQNVNGLTQSDLLGLGGLLVAVVLIVREVAVVRQRSRRD